MPLYEYQCQECGETQEVIQRHSDPAYTICPSCGGTLKKLISSPAIQFKGSGFYITDYGKGNSGPAKGEASKSEAPKSEAPKSSDAGSSASKASSTKE